MTLDQIDLFKLLRLDHLSDEDKLAFINKIAQAVMANLVTVDMPLFLTSDQIDKFNEFSAKEDTQPQAIALLKEHFPDFDSYLTTKMMDAKKDLVRANIEERLEINNQSENANKEEQKVALEKMLAAIDVNDWVTVDNLASTV